MSAPPVQPPPIQAPTPGNVVVRKYDPKAAAVVKRRDDEQFLVSPITGERIPANKVAEHMKVGLLDPRWVEERDKHITAKATEDVVFAPGQAIEASLKGLAERRTDIFGVGEEAAQETHIGQKMGEEEQQKSLEKVTWDGHSSAAEAAARAARANISLDDQIAQIHRQKGLIPEPETKTVVVVPPQMAPPSQPMMHPVVVGVPVRPAMMVPAPMYVQQQMQQQQQQQAQQQQQMQQQQQQQQQQRQQQQEQDEPLMKRQQEQDEPPMKRQRTEDNLIPESEFMARNLSPVAFKVTVPMMEDKTEWSLNGQTLTLTL